MLDAQLVHELGRRPVQVFLALAGQVLRLLPDIRFMAGRPSMKLSFFIISSASHRHPVPGTSFGLLEGVNGKQVTKMCSRVIRNEESDRSRMSFFDSTSCSSFSTSVLKSSGESCATGGSFADSSRCESNPLPEVLEQRVQGRDGNEHVDDLEIGRHAGVAVVVVGPGRRRGSAGRASGHPIHPVGGTAVVDEEELVVRLAVLEPELAMGVDEALAYSSRRVVQERLRRSFTA